MPSSSFRSPKAGSQYLLDFANIVEEDVIGASERSCVVNLHASLASNSTALSDMHGIARAPSLATDACRYLDKQDRACGESFWIL